MAKLYGRNDAVDFAAKNLITFNGSFARGAGQPLDKTAVWYPKDGLTGYERAYAYAQTEAAYVGQELAVIAVTYEEDGTTVKSTEVKFYGIQDANGTLKELGAIPVGDESTITVDEDGKISLSGIEALVFEEDIIGDNGEATGEKKEVKYQPLLTASGLTWVKPSETTVEGLATLIEALESKAAKIESDVAANTSAIGAEVTARETAIKAVTDSIGAITEGSTVVSMIEAALAEAKQYADDNDADTIYDDTGVKARIKAIEDDYLKDADKYDDTEVKADISDHESRIGAIESAIGNETDGIVKDIADNAKAIEDEAKARAQADADTLNSAKAYTDEEIVGLEITIEKKTVGEVESEYIVIKNKAGTEVASVNAAKFVKDGMLDSADYSTETKKLTLTWNTDAGKAATEIDLNDLVNTYTGSEHIIVDTDGSISIGEHVALDSDLTSLETTLSTAVSNESKAREDADKALGERIDGVKATAEAAAVKTEVEAALELKADKTALDAHVEAYEGFVEGYNSEKATFATKTDLENKVDTTTYNNDKANLATKAEVDGQFKSVGDRLDLVNETIEANAAAVTETLKDYAKTSEVATTLEGYYTKEEVYTKGETDNKIDAKIASVTGGESAADVKSALESYRDALNQEIWGATAGNWTTTTVDGEGKTKVVYNPKYNEISRIDTLENEVGQINSKNEAQDTAISANTSSITALDTSVKNLQDGIATLGDNYSGLNTQVTTDIAPRLSAVETTLNGSESTDGLVATVANHTAKISGLESKDSELAGLIQANTDKFANYYTAEQVDAKIGDIDYSEFVTDSEFEAYQTSVSTELGKKAVATEVAASFEAVNAEVAKKANADNVYDKTTADATFVKGVDFEALVDARVNALIDGANAEDTITKVTDLVNFVNENAGDIAQLVTDVKANGEAIEAQAALIAANDTAIKANAAAIEALGTTVNTGLAAATVHTSTEIEVAARTGEGATGVELSIKEVNVNKLVQTEGDVLILNGGNATV